MDVDDLISEYWPLKRCRLRARSSVIDRLCIVMIQSDAGILPDYHYGRSQEDSEGPGIHTRRTNMTFFSCKDENNYS